LQERRALLTFHGIRIIMHAVSGLESSNPYASRQTILIGGLVALLSFAAFLPALRAGFVNWDDDRLLVENTAYRGLMPDNVVWMFTSSVLGHYQPVTWLTYGIDYCLWGMNPLGYHLTNLLFHAACAVLVYLLALRLLSNLPAAAIAALLFAVHPLRVESVAWVTERRDVVSLFFMLGCVLAYLHHAAAPNERRNWYIASVVLMALSLLSKAWAITLPIVLIVLDIYVLRRTPRETWRILTGEKLPFAILAMVGALAAIRAQASAGMESLESHGWESRIAQAAYGLTFYLWKTLIPAGITPLYERPAQLDLRTMPYIACAALVLATSFALVALRSKCPRLLAAWLIYITILLPVLGLTQAGPQLVADRYSYVACIVWPLAIGGVISRLKSRIARPASLALASAAIIVLGFLTWQQTTYWRDSHCLWSRCIAVDRHCAVAHSNLGVLFFAEDKLDDAESHLREAVRVKPDYTAAMINLGSTLGKAGRLDEALRTYRDAARLDLNKASIGNLINLANGFLILSKPTEAEKICRSVLERDPQNVSARQILEQIALSR
jgi:tetratricopeptide (TPR) repeat protein